MKSSNLFTFYLLPLTFYLLHFSLFAQENIQWRGTDRSGVYQETGLLKTWGEKGPDLLWNYDGVGEGYSSVAIDADKIYVTGVIDKMGYIFALDLNGKLLHKKEYGQDWEKGYNGPRGTVTVNGGKIYSISGLGDIYCFDQQTLNIIWKKNILTEFNSVNLKFGFTEAPLVVGNKVIVTPGGKEHNIVALNKNTGDLIWSCAGEGDSAAYCSPLYIGDQQVPQIVTMTLDHILAINPENGKKLWSYPIKNQYSIHANTPIYSNNMILTTSGDAKGAVMLKLIDGGRNVQEVWFQKELDGKLGAMVKVGNYVYGSGDDKKFWSCTDWQTGELKWKSSTIGPGCVIAADGMFYGYTEKGEMFLAKANPEKFDFVSKFKITLGTELHFAHPVIYKGVLYVRHGDAVMAYKIKK